MTYCVGLQLDCGLIFMSDTRTNAGVDNISKFRKTYTWEVPGERSIVVMTAGNLATTQTTIGLLDERSKAPANRQPSLLQVPTMFQAAQLVGRTLREVITEQSAGEVTANADFSGTMILGGQITGGKPTMFMIYPEGNFIEVSNDTPFQQIGEIKYGRPILVRSYEPGLSFGDAVKLLLVSFDSTIKANVSVAPPLDIVTYPTDAFRFSRMFRIEKDDPQFRAVSDGWATALRSAFSSLPDFDLDRYADSESH